MRLPTSARLLPISLLFLCFQLPASLQAAQITFYFQGEVTQGGNLPSGCGGSVGAGAPFTGSLTFETNTPDLHPAPEQAIHPGAIVATSFQLQGVNYTHATNGSMQYQDGYNAGGGECGGALHDQLNFFPNARSTACTATFALSITRIDCSGSMLATAGSMPTQPPDASFMPFLFQMVPTRGGETIHGIVTSLSLEPPTPVLTSTWGLLKRGG